VTTPRPPVPVQLTRHAAAGGRHEVVGACALDCPDGCSWVVTVEGGRAVALRGNHEHPFTRGGLCAKVAPYLDYAASPQRLLHPLRRVGAKGEGRFERVSWDDALAEIAGRLRATIDEHGAEAIWPYAGTGTVGWVQGIVGAGKRLFHSLGASRHDVDICSRAGHVGMQYTTGSAAGMDPADLEHSGLIVLWGTNTLTTNLHLWPYVTAGRERGAPLVVVDPVRTRTAARADLHLAPRPGTDAALALGVAALLVELGAADEAYLERWALGWEEFRDGVLARWPVERTAEVCGLDPGEVRLFAELAAVSRPLGIRTLMGVQRHAGGAAVLRAMSCLPAVTGDYARHGGGLCYSTSSAYALDEAALARPDLQPCPQPGRQPRQLRMSRLGRELLERDDPPVQALLVWGGNPVVSNPDQRRTRAGLARPDLFTVVVEHVPTETTAYADLVLPGTTQLEHADLNDSYSHLYLHWNAPAVAPPGECLPHTEIFRRLAVALGVDDPAVLAGDEQLARDALGTPELAAAGVTLERLQERGWLRLPVPDPYLPFAAGYPTPSGRFEFASERAERDGFGRFPGWTPPHEASASGGPGRRDAGGSLDLVTPAAHHLLNSTFATSPRHRRPGAVAVVLHPLDALERGLADGDLVRVTSPRGAFEAPLRLDDGIRRGVAVSTKGHAPELPGGATVNATVSDAGSDGGGATFHDNRVEVRLVARAAVAVQGTAAPSAGGQSPAEA
jgi:anaerobic selenocysteine-containing dehydrogenase